VKVILIYLKSTVGIAEEDSRLKQNEHILSLIGIAARLLA
jgi:hypothetical protein